MTITIANVLPRQKGDALRLLFPEFVDGHGAANDLLSTPGMNRLIGAFTADSELVAVALINANLGSIASLVGPACKAKHEFARRPLLDQVEAYARKIGVHIVQATLPSESNSLSCFLESVSYQVVAKIEGRAKPVSSLKVNEEYVADEISFEEVGAAEEARFANVMESTFDDSQDLPYFQRTCSKSETSKAIHASAGSNSARFAVTACGKDVGCALLKHEADQVELSYFGVVPKSRGLGVGKKIIQFSESWAKEKKASLITAYVDSENYVAKSVYDDREFAIFSQQVVVAKELG